MPKHNHPDHIHCGDRACPAFEFKPAFDMPTTAQEALAVIEAWGSPDTITFSSARAKRCAELLSECDLMCDAIRRQLSLQPST